MKNADSLPPGAGAVMDAQPTDPRTLSVGQRVAILVKALDGARRTNEALANCSNGDQMVEVLLDASAKLGLGLTRADLTRTPPIRDWIWWKNKEALLTIGDARPRYQQDGDRGKSAEPAAEGDVTPRRRFLGLF
jgi:hypothetical protein